MKKEEDIIILIKSLSKSEKRYFKLFVGKNSKGDSNHFVKLFDLLEKSGTAKKKQVQKLYGNDYFIQQHFSPYKNKLYNQILKSLRSYHSGKHADDEIMELIRDAKILFNKTLYDQSVKILKKAKKTAFKYEKFTLLLEIIHWQKKIFIYWAINNSASDKEIVQLLEEEKSITHKIENESKYWKQYALMHLATGGRGEVKEKKKVDTLKGIINVPILQEEELALSYEAKKLFHKTYLEYFFAVNNSEKAFDYTKNVVELIESHSHQIEEDPIQYGGALHNILVVILYKKKYEEFFKMIPKLKLIVKKFKQPFAIRVGTYNIELAAYLRTGQYKKAAELIPEIELILKAEKNNYSLNKFYIIQNIALIHFINSEYREALSKLNLILNENNFHLNEDDYRFFKVFELVIHFEKGNAELLPYLLKSFYRYLMQKKQYPLERVILKFFKTVLNSKTNRREQMENFKLFKNELVKLNNDHRKEILLGQFDLISWLESKIEKRPFGEILIEKL